MTSSLQFANAVPLKFCHLCGTSSVVKKEFARKRYQNSVNIKIWKRQAQHIGETYYHKGEQNKGAQQIELSTESNQFKKKQIWENLKYAVTGKTATDQ